MGGKDLKVNVFVNYWKQLSRSFALLAHSCVLLAHYTALFTGCMSRSVRCFVEVVRWTSVVARGTVSAFESVHRNLYRWTWTGRRGGGGGGGVSMETLSSSGTESD